MKTAISQTTLAGPAPAPIVLTASGPDIPDFGQKSRLAGASRGNGAAPDAATRAPLPQDRVRPDLSAEQEALIDDLETFIPRLRRYARSLTADATRADDLTQDTLLRALDKLYQFQPGTNLLAWLFTIMRNTHLNGIRSAKFTKDADPHEIQIPTQGNQIDSLALQELSLAIQSLPEDQRETLLLIGVEGMAYQEAAEIMDVPIGTVRSRLSRARSALKPLLEGTDFVHKAEVS